uniref:Uncharacterized protein n=1 Tax=Cannabis sativa TaxID=3483 RepID=A0A803QSY4_CANSA
MILLRKWILIMMVKHSHHQIPMMMIQKMKLGFQVDHLPNNQANWSSFVVESFYKTYDKYTIEAAHAAIAEFNKLKGANLELKKL